MDLGGRIQSLRKALGLSQEALADRLGVSRQAIGKWESGSSFPSIDNLMELAKQLDTTVDYLLTGRDPLAYEAGQELPAQSQPELVSLETLQALLEANRQQETHRRRKRILWLASGGILILAVLFGVLLYSNSRVSGLEEEIGGLRFSMETLNGQVQGTLSGVQADIENSLSQQASILSGSDYALGEYDPETKTALLHLSAAPKTLTEDTTLKFVLSPMTSSEDTLEKPISAQGRLSAENGQNTGVFTADVSVPMVQDFVVSVLLTQEGVQYSENVMTQYGFSSQYICTLTAEMGTFSWSTSSLSGGVTISGSPQIFVAPPVVLSAPRPDRLEWALYIDGTEVQAGEIDVYRELYGEKGAIGPDADTALLDACFYPLDGQSQSYEGSLEPEVRWEFTLWDTAGNELTEELTF